MHIFQRKRKLSAIAHPAVLVLKWGSCNVKKRGNMDQEIKTNRHVVVGGTGRCVCRGGRVLCSTPERKLVQLMRAARLRIVPGGDQWICRTQIPHEGIIPEKKMATENMLGLSTVTVSSFPGLSVRAKQTFPDCRSGKLVIDSGYCAGRCQPGLFSFSSSDEIE